MARPISKFDRLGRPQHDPHRLFHGIEGAIILAEWMPPKQVPPEFWQLDADDQGEKVAVVACPCGQNTTVPLLEALQSCEGCDRSFFFESRNVYCFKPGEPDAVDTSDDEATIVPA